MKPQLKELLDQYAAYRRQEAQATTESAGEYAKAAGRTADELRGLWAAHGDDSAELDKLLHETDFRERVLALYRGPAQLPNTKEYREAHEAQKDLTVELREYWLSSGHDLEELRQFESTVDAQVFDLIIT